MKGKKHSDHLNSVNVLLHIPYSLGNYHLLPEVSLKTSAPVQWLRFCVKVNQKTNIWSHTL